MRLFWRLAPLLVALPLLGQSLKPERDPAQPIDEEYTRKIREYTTAPFFNSPLTDYLPASKTVPTPKAVLGDIAGAPGILPVLARSLSLHADAGGRQPAREGLQYRAIPKRVAR